MKKIITIMLSALMAVLACLSLTACSTSKAGITDGKLTIGYTIYPPMNYTENGEFIGFDTELAKAFCVELGVEAEFVEIDWNNKFIDLESKNIDVIWNGMTITEEAKEKTAVSAPYLNNKQVVVCKASNASKFTDVQSVLTASSIAVETESAGNLVVADLGYADSKINKATAQRDTLLEVASGASEIAVIDLLMAQVLVGEGTDFADLTFVDVGFENEDFGVAFRKDDVALARAFDLFIKLSKTNGLFDSLQAKYFG